MRSFEDRMAEISRRSEERIKERKRSRDRLITVCAALVLCSGICTVSLLPGMMERENRKGESEANHGQSTVMESTNSDDLFGTVEVYGDGISLCHTGATEVNRITELIQGAITVVSQESSDVSGDLEDMQEVSESFDYEDQEEKTYTVIVSAPDGTTAEYTLSQGKLINRDTLKVYPVNDRDMAALLEALGIPAN